ncbi:hypothetical protein KIW84_075045 [Lathyrus oleraceus]|uniref:Uncharacterized protein n=1 Tax=Pisum sativum TaxID=3888 RepID=A0A9D4VTV2_PEA|nr:hypothetical protein KIW84_075045 [Pisum sativum]
MVFLAEPSMDVNNFPKDWLGKLDLKPFAFNNMLHLLPTLWCLGKSNLSHVVIYSDDQQRKHLWNSLQSRIPNTLCCFIGDFNAIISADEYKGNHWTSSIPMQDFFHWSDSNHYIHIPTLGNKFTWSNGRKGRQLTEKRLDREAYTVLALAAVSAGVAVATVSDLEFNLYGKMANPTHRYSGKMAKLKWLS